MCMCLCGVCVCLCVCVCLIHISEYMLLSVTEYNIYSQFWLLLCYIGNVGYLYNIFIGIQKMSSILKAMKDPNYHYDNMEMESHNLPKSHSKSTTEPQYEECRGGVTSSNVAMEENPAYQSVDVAVAKP